MKTDSHFPPKGTHSCAVLALKINLGKRISKDPLGLRKTHVANYLSSVLAKSEGSEKTWNPMTYP